MQRLATVIIADDLTGALDSIAPFAALGMDCAVATTPKGLAQAVAKAPEVVAVNLGTREAGPRQAGTLAKSVAAALQQVAWPGTVWLKKIDSRMKGQVAAEVAAVASVLGAAEVLLCPAIPELGRIVSDGHIAGVGVAIQLPVTLQLDGDLAVNAPDARTDADLDRLLMAAAPGTLYVGARGLAAAIARRLRPGRPAVAACMCPGPVGFLIGSRDPITQAQVVRLKATGQVRWIAAPDGVVPPLVPPGGFILQATPGAGASPGNVAARLAAGTVPYLAGLGTILTTGGETSAALLVAADIRVLRVLGEVLPGLPLCHAPGAPNFPALVTKSGGLGAPDCLATLWQAAHCVAEPKA